MAFGVLDVGRNWGMGARPGSQGARPSGGGGGGSGSGYAGSSYTGAGGSSGFGASRPSSGLSFQSVFDLLQNRSATQFEGYQNQRDMLGHIQNLQTARWGERAGEMRQDADLRLRGIGLDERALGVQRADNAIDARGAQRDIGYYSQLLGQMPEYRALTDRSYANDLAGIARQGNMERIGISSDYTGRGAYTAPMHRVGLDNSRAAEGQARESTDIGYRRDVMGLDEKQWGLERNRGGAQDSADKIANRGSYLDIEAQRLGLSRQQIEHDLAKGLSQLGYDQFLSAADLKDRLNSTNQQEAALARQIFEQAVGLSHQLGAGAVGDAYSEYTGQYVPGY